MKLVNILSSVLLITASVAVSQASVSGLLVKDDWADSTITQPVQALVGSDWNIESGSFSADAAAPPSGGFLNPVSQVLMFGSGSRSRISINIGNTSAYMGTEVRFKLCQPNFSSSNYLFQFGLKDITSGYTYIESASPNSGYYGVSGFNSMAFSGAGPNDWGSMAGTTGKSLSFDGSWDFIKFRFTPQNGIEIWCAPVSPADKSKSYDDLSIIYTKVASWNNYWNLMNVNQFFMDNCSATLSWMVDDVEVKALQWILSENAVQTVYQNGVPHTDAKGVQRMQYDPAESFLPIGLYHFWVGTSFGQTLSFSDLSNAGFNCCHLYERQRPTTAIADSAVAAGIRIITHYATDYEVSLLRNHPAVFGWFEDEEPTGGYWYQDMVAKYQAFLDRRIQIKAIDPVHPVFILDCPWISSPATDWWVKWNTAGDISSHDNYPLNATCASLNYYQGIPESVSLAVSSNNQSKPLLFCAQAHYVDSVNWGLNFPTPNQERCMVYTALIHGATGIIYFGLDSYVLRDARCIGIAPNPMAEYQPDKLIATPEQLQQSQTLWNGIVQLNSQLSQLKPSIFSPTANISYVVYIDNSFSSVTSDPIRTLLKVNPSGGYTMLLSNVDKAVQKVRIVFPGRKLNVHELFGTQGILKVADGVFELTCSEFDSRTLQFDLVNTTSGIREAKIADDGAVVGITGVVTVNFGDYFYIESADRSIGIRVSKPAYGTSVNKTVQVIGTMSTLPSGERVINASSVSDLNIPAILSPLGMTNKSLGGGSFVGQVGVTDGVGLNNIGLFVKTTGYVSNCSDNTFTIADGSNVGVEAILFPGLDMPSSGSYVAVTGIVSCNTEGGGNVRRVILVTSVTTCK